MDTPQAGTNDDYAAAQRNRRQSALNAVRAAAVRCRGRTVHVVTGVRGCDGFESSPDWCEFDVSDAMINEILRLATICVEQDLAYATVWNYSCTYTEGHEEVRTDLDRLQVYDSMFVFAACYKNADVKFESCAFYLPDFFEDVANAPAGETLYLTDGDEGDIDELKALYEGTDEDEAA